MGCSDGTQACSATSTDQWGVTSDWLLFVPFYVLFSSSPLVLPWPTKRSLSSVPQAHLKYPQLSYSSCFLLLISYKFLSKAVPDNPWWSHQLMAKDFCPFPVPLSLSCARGLCPLHVLFLINFSFISYSCGRERLLEWIMKQRPPPSIYPWSGASCLVLEAQLWM